MRQDQPVCCAATSCSCSLPLASSLPGFTWTSVILADLGGGRWCLPGRSLLSSPRDAWLRNSCPCVRARQSTLFRCDAARALRRRRVNQPARYTRARKYVKRTKLRNYGGPRGTTGELEARGAQDAFELTGCRPPARRDTAKAPLPALRSLPNAYERARLVVHPRRRARFIISGLAGMHDDDARERDCARLKSAPVTDPVRDLSIEPATLRQLSRDAECRCAPR